LSRSPSRHVVFSHGGDPLMNDIMNKSLLRDSISARKVTGLPERRSVLAEDLTTVQRTRRSIENFRGDYQGLAQLVQRSWGENSQQGLCYSAEFLESFLTSPGASASLAPAIYEEDALIGIASGFPRQATVRGHSLRLITSSFLSVLPEYKKFGFGIALWTELVKRARNDGFDGMLNFCVDGEPMNRMVEGCCRRLNLQVLRIFFYSLHVFLAQTRGFRRFSGSRCRF